MSKNDLAIQALANQCETLADALGERAGNDSSEAIKA